MSEEFYEYEFGRLLVYQKSILFINEVYTVTKKFPQEEQYRITSQFIRASHSIALNIAEGTGGTKPEFKNFLRIAKRSAREMYRMYNCCFQSKFLN